MSLNTSNLDLLEGDLEGSVDVQLAPVKGIDLRRKLPSEYFIKKPFLFLGKFFFAFLLIALSWAGIWYSISTQTSISTILILAFSILVSGLIYAHLIELQHECLHFHAFKSHKLNRLYGVLAGLFMFSSHSHYRYDHLIHHAYLGTERNQEHFDYRFNDLSSLRGFLIAFFDLDRYKRVFSILSAAITGKPLKNISKEKVQRHIKQEYLFYAFIFILSVVASIYFKTWFFALAWWIPTLFISEGAHFMIEMPEHYGLNTQTNPDVVSNTRTIRTNSIVAWYVNGNHIHTAHHFHQGIPMCNLKMLNELIKPKINIVESSYFMFYRDVISGRIKNNSEGSCMER